MKKIVLLIVTILISIPATFSQKKDRTDAYMYNKQGQYYQAMQSIEKCINHSSFYGMLPNDQSIAWLYRAVIYWNIIQSNDESLLAQVPKALEVVYESLIKCIENKDFFEQNKQEIYTRASAVMNVYYNQGVDYYNAGRFAEATPLFKRTYDIAKSLGSPDANDMLNLAAISAFKAENYSMAKTHYSELLRDGVDNPDIRSKIAECDDKIRNSSYYSNNQSNLNSSKDYTKPTQTSQKGNGNDMFGKIAVLDFKAGAGISQNDVNGISAVFTTYFSPRGYTIVERNQVDQVLREQNFQGSSLTEYDMVRLGQILNVNKIVVGDVNILAGEYNVDVRVVDVQGAYVTGRDGASFPQGSGYRQTMKELAERLASQIAIVTSSNVGSNTTNTSNIQNPATPTSPITLHGYLIVYPEDLGVFSSEPTGIISALNNSNSFGHRNWRLPTDEELAVMMGSKGSLNIKGTDYMTIENCRRDNDKSVRLVTLADGFADMNRIITVNGTRYMVMSSDADDLEMYTIEQCNTKRAFGYSDWQEPTIEMLRIMYSRKKMIGGFHDDTYMSKSVGSEHMGMGYYRDTSLGIDFSNGVECDCGHRLRPVRKID